jgi:hypothetical protein
MPPEPRLMLGLELDDDTVAAAAATNKVDNAAAVQEHDLQVQRLRLHQPSQTAHGFKKSSSGTGGDSGGGGGRRSSRAPRMRWTTALHAHFVHAVELLGGHESMLNSEHQLISATVLTYSSGYLNSFMGLSLLILPLLLILSWCSSHRSVVLT